MKSKIYSSIESAKLNAIKAINYELVKRNYEIGRYIVEYELNGEKRAIYGAETLKLLSVDLTERYGKGFDITNLKRFRQFYLLFEKGAPVEHQLSWTNIKLLIKVEDSNKREFYRIECEKNNWSRRELERQIDSQLYDRLLMSKDKNKVLEMSIKGQIIEKPEDIIKDPIILEFLNLKEESSYNETDLEEAIINKLQDFILELGKGFSFVARQYKISISGINYYADLVFYNRFLRCFVVIELKLGKLKPEYLGQLQFYVRYFDEKEKTLDENDTIGILVCSEKNNAIVKIALPKENNNIFAVEYKKYLPDEKELQKKINLIDKKV